MRLSKKDCTTTYISSSIDSPVNFHSSNELASVFVMSSLKSISKLLDNGNIWQGSLRRTVTNAVSTGYKVLDENLFYSGWPQGGVSELLSKHRGGGEIRLLSPLLSRLSQQTGQICWVNPPFVPYAPALALSGIDVRKLVIVAPKTPKALIWSAIQAMTSNACSAVLVWLPKKEMTKEMRQLNLAAKKGNCWGVVLRDSCFAEHTSPSVLRIKMETINNKYQLSIIKQPGGWSDQIVCLDLFPERATWTNKRGDGWSTFSPTVNNSETERSDLKEHPQEGLSSRLLSINSLERSLRR